MLVSAVKVNCCRQFSNYHTTYFSIYHMPEINAPNDIFIMEVDTLKFVLCLSRNHFLYLYMLGYKRGLQKMGAIWHNFHKLLIKSRKKIGKVPIVHSLAAVLSPLSLFFSFSTLCVCVCRRPVCVCVCLKSCINHHTLIYLNSQILTHFTHFNLSPFCC